MDTHIHLHLHLADALAPLVQAITTGVDHLVFTLTQQGTHMSAALDALTAEVAATRSVQQSAITLIEGIAQRIADAGTDQAALDALTAELTASSASLAAAVAANTPQVP